MEIEPKVNSNIVVDLFRTEIPHTNCLLPKTEQNKIQDKGVQIWRGFNGIKLQVTGKIFADARSYGGINLHNVENLTEIIYKETGADIDFNYLYKEAPLYEVHTNKDIITKGPILDYISDLREVLKACSNKYDVNRYDNVVYSNGIKVIEKPEPCSLAIIPKTKKKNRFIIYSKWAEINCHEDTLYSKHFDSEFLNSTRNVLRFEYQIRNFEDMRKAFGLSDLETPTLYRILSSKNNPVSEMYNKLISEYEKEKE